MARSAEPEHLRTAAPAMVSEHKAQIFGDLEGPGLSVISGVVTRRYSLEWLLPLDHGLTWATAQLRTAAFG